MVKLTIVKLLVLIVFVTQGRQITKTSLYTSSIYDSLFNVQNWRKIFDSQMVPLFGNDWQKERILEIGDQFGNQVIGERIVNGSGIVRLNDYKGKLVILDYWATWCGACMVQLSHMEELQKKLDKQIQVLLVNYWEDEKKVIKRLKEINRQIDLPIIAGTKELKASFPAHFIPYHIWIDSLGIVRLKGPSINTYEKKIKDLLNGLEIIVLDDESTAPGFDPQLPYYKIIGKDISNHKDTSFFAPYNPKYAPIIGGRNLYYKDSAIQAFRTTFVNSTVFDLFVYAFQEDLQIKNLIYNPYVSNIYLNLKDTTLVTDYFVNQLNQTDLIHKRSRYCYEQIAPYSWSEAKMKSAMKKDLIQYFGDQLKIDVNYSLELLPVKVLTNVKNSLGNFSSKIDVGNQSSDTFFFKGKMVYRCKGVSVLDAIKSSQNAWDVLINEFRDVYCIDGLKGGKVKSLILPLKGTFNELKDLLELQGFTFANEEMEIPQLLIGLK